MAGQDEQSGTHLGLIGPSGRYSYPGAHTSAGRGSEPVSRNSAKNSGHT